VAALVVAGALLVAVLWPRGQPEGVTPTPILEADMTIAPRPYTVAEVRQAFRQNGLPLTEEEPLVEGVRTFVSQRADQVFQVEVYSTVEQARRNQRGVVIIVTSVGDGPRGEVLDQTKANVRVIYDEGRPVVRRKFRKALASLGST
jgi:hypothetical protein